MHKKKSIVWFRKDLRVHDNPALWTAANHGQVLPIFIWSPEEEGDWLPGGASLWWLHDSLGSLGQSLLELGAKLILLRGPSLSVIQRLMEETHADALYFNERAEPCIRQRDDQVTQVLRQAGKEVKTFNSSMLFEPDSVLNQQGRAYKIFTPFWKQCRQKQVALPLPAPPFILPFEDGILGTPLEEMPLLPSKPWFGKFASHWMPGEKAALKGCREFAETRVEHYMEFRDFPASPMVSRLSPHLAWGEISPRWIWHCLLDQHELDHRRESYLRQLGWREFSYQQIMYFPEITESPLRPEFSSFPWENREEDFEKWKKGQTGYPLIDAGMRELWETGWMHNRVRMASASFLVKHLLISWKNGLSWFWDTLLDADLANNSMGWQWVAGTGFDAAPYFRIFNPMAQGEKFDSNGDYIRRWIPELANLPAPYIHRPWEAPKKMLDEASVLLGKTYPFPMIDHSQARERALAAYQSIKTR